MQARLNWLLVFSAPVDSLPEVGLGTAPHAPEEVQDVAFVEDQVSVDDPPLVTDGGVAARDTMGAGGDTVTVADALWVPPDPVQERLKVLVLVNAPVVWLPDVALAPDQPPEALQEVAFVEDHASVVDAPLATDVGFAAIDTVGAGGGGGVPETVTAADVLAVPPEPVQLRE